MGNSAGNSFAPTLVEYLCSVYIPVDESNDDLSDRYIRLYIANGTVGMLREWVEKDFPIRSRKIAEKMYFLSRKVTY